jgi:hypothetical protein
MTNEAKGPDGLDPKIAAGLRAAVGTLPVQPGERFRFEFVVGPDGTVRCSFPPPQLEAEFWKMYAYLPDVAKGHYRKANEKSPLAI